MAKRKQTTELLNYGVKHIAFIMDGNGRWAKKTHATTKLWSC
jgi:undecaprenyl pyrophosphate synthase